jgi:divalent metal cation (Fe/Co/Zn/Cd) transporter
VATVDLVEPGSERVLLARRARLLAWTSLAWLGFEGMATAGVLAGSVALVANGLDSGIEAMASVIVVWRFAAARISSDRAERTAQRLVAVSFFLLAPYVAAEAIRALAIEHHAETTWLGIGLSLGTLLICPWLGRAKIRLGARLNSRATAGARRCGHDGGHPHARGWPRALFQVTVSGTRR